MEMVITHHKILTYLTLLENQLIITNKNGEGALAKTCEGLIRELFSLIYGKNFHNVNLLISNFPAIDIHSLEEKIAIQVTSNRTDDKIIDCFDKFFKYKMNNLYDNFIIVVLGNKNYDLNKLNKRYAQIELKHKVSYPINLKETLLDLSSIYNKISQELPSEKVNEILLLLIRYFEVFKASSSLEPYYEQLRNNFFEVVMDDPKGLTLNSIYIDPGFIIHKTSANRNSKEIKEVYGDYLPINDLSIHQFLNDKFENKRAYDDMFSSPNSKLTFILGYPGQGKTSLCSKFLFDQLNLPLSRNIFYLKLRNISDTKSLIHNPFNVIFNELENQFGSNFDKELLKNSITVLDGLDELYMKDNLSANDIETFCKDLIKEAEKYNNWHIIITTRHGYINFERLYKESYIALILKPLDINRQKLWLNNYRSFYPESWFTVSKLVDFYKLKLNNRKSHILELIDQPLLLYIVASLENEINENSNRTEIYSKLFGQIIERRYSNDGQIENLKTLSKNDLRTMLQEIAFLIFISNREYVTTNEILKNDDMQPFLEKIGDNHLSGTLKGILISFYFKERNEDIQKGEPAGIEFFHKSLQEYLTAEKLVYAVFNKLLNKDLHGEYVIKKNEDFLILLNDLFGRMVIRNEIRGFIKELILGYTIEERTELALRLNKPLSYLFSKDFIYEIRKEEINGFEKSMYTFQAYWFFLQSLNVKLNYLVSKTLIHKLNSYLSFIEMHENIPLQDKLINYQEINGIRIKGWFFMDEEIINTRFINSDIENIAFYDCFVSKSVFENCHIEDIQLCDSKVEGLKLTNCSIQKLSFEDLKNTKIVLDKCEFTNSIELKHLRKGSIFFKNCIFHERMYSSMLPFKDKVKFEECILRKSIKVKNRLKMEHIDTSIKNN